MATFVGRAAAPAPAPAPEPKAVPEAKALADRTRAELVEEAEALGVEVPPKATKAQIVKLIEDAPVM